MKHTRIQLIIALVCIVFGSLLFRIKSDVQFAKLTPTEESKYLVPMQSSSTYDEDIVVHNKIISRIGVYFLPLHPLLQHEGIIHLSLLRGAAVVESVAINSKYIDSATPTEFIFAHPIASATDELVRMRVTVSDSISTDIALRNRIPDNDFTGEDVAFSIDGVAQQYPFAYTAAEVLHPSLMKQLGGLFIAIGLALVLIPYFKKHALLRDHILLGTVAVLQSFSAWGSSAPMALYAVFVFGILVAAWWILRIAGRSRLASLFGACVAACSSWVPLMMISSHGGASQLSLKDTLLDPNQIVVSHAAGAYVGFFAFFFAGVGIGVLIWKLTRSTRRKMAVDVVVFSLLCIASMLAFTPLFVPIPFASIIVALSIAWFAALGFDATERFAGIQDKLVFVLLTILVCVAVLDLMHVASVTLAYGYSL